MYGCRKVGELAASIEALGIMKVIRHPSSKAHERNGLHHQFLVGLGTINDRLENDDDDFKSADPDFQHLAAHDGLLCQTRGPSCEDHIPPSCEDHTVTTRVGHTPPSCEDHTPPSRVKPTDQLLNTIVEPIVEPIAEANSERSDLRSPVGENSSDSQLSPRMPKMPMATTTQR